METKGAVGGVTWGDQMDAANHSGGAWRKCPQSPSQKWERQPLQAPAIPFLLQDERECREAAHTLYRHVKEMGLSIHQTALQGMWLCHPEANPEVLTCLNNQVLLMIAEYHLIKGSLGSHSVAPVLPEALELILPPLEEYLPGNFQGSRDFRMSDRANTLQIVVWLHRLDLAATYGRSVTTSLEVDRYDMGPLLGYFLALGTSGLIFEEVSLADHRARRKELQQEVKLLIQTWDREMNKERKKSVKRRLDQRRKDLRKVEELLLDQECLMGIRGEHSSVGDEPHPKGGLDTIVEGVTEEAVQDPGTTPPSNTTPEQEAERPMEVEGSQSPITASDDAVFTGTGEMGVEAGMPTLWVHSTPERPEDDGEGASGGNAS